MIRQLLLALALLLACSATRAQQQNFPGSSSGSSSPGWHRLGTIIGPAVAADQGNITESRTIVDTTCPLLTNLLAGETCFRTWGAAGWSAGGVAYWEAPTADAFAVVRSATVTPANYAHVSVSKCGSTYYLTAATPFGGSTHIDLFSSATGNQDWALLQANVVTLGAGGQFDSNNVDNTSLACAGTLDGTNNVYLYYDAFNGTNWHEGVTVCAASCFSGSATWTKSVNNPLLTESQSVSGCEARSLNSTVVLRCHGEVVGTGVVPSDLLPLYRSSSPTGPFTRSTATLDMQRGTFDEGLLNNTGQIQKPTTLDVNGSCYLFYNADEDGLTANGIGHEKLAIAFTTCAAMALTNGGAVEPDRLTGMEWLHINTPYAPPAPGLEIGYGTTAVAPGPHLFLQNILNGSNTSLGLTGTNCFISNPASAPLQINTSYGCAGWQFNSGSTNAATTAFQFLESIGGVRSFSFQAAFDASNNVYDLIPQHTATGTAPVITGTGACATITTQLGAWTGSFKCTGATAASTVTMTFDAGIATNGWNCGVQDETTRANLLQQTSHSATTCVLTATSVTQNDVFTFTAIGF